MNREWRRLRNEELRSLYRSPNIVRTITSRRLKWAGHVAKMEEFKSAFKIVISKPAGKKPLGRPRRRWRTILEWTLKRNRVDSAKDRDYWRALVIIVSHRVS